MNEIANKFLLAREKFMPEMHLRQLGFTYSVCGPFGENKERIKKFKKSWGSRHVCQNELDKVCFQHDMAFEDFIDLNRRTFADIVLRDKVFDIKTSGSGIKNKNIYNKELAENYTNQLLQSLIKEKCTRLL